MPIYEVFGADPGIVHTGLVGIQILTTTQQIYVNHHVVNGIDGAAASLWVRRKATRTPLIVFQEKYKPRGALAHNVSMVKAEQEYQQALGSTLLLNTGVKSVVRKPLLELLGLWSFTTVTHHQDLRSAARIAVLGMLKDDHLNTILAGIVSDHIEGKTWNVSAS